VVENRAKIEEALKNKEIDVAFCTKWPFIGDFMKFLEVKGFLRELKKIIGTQKRQMVAIHIFVIIYILKLMIGIPRIRGTEELLSDKGAMKLLGFNFHVLENGICKRGDANQHGKELKKNPFPNNGQVYIIR
jgi:preprotein translocase subunit SecE